MPLDVLLEILILLPVNSAVRFKIVCKEWYNLINSPIFAKLHVKKSLESKSGHNRSLFCTCTLSVVDDLYNPLKWTKLNWPNDTIIDDVDRHLVGSCNGLVCFKVFPNSKDTTMCSYTVRCFLICNPTTRTFKLVLPSSENKWNSRGSSYGFGYDSDHDDYKIIATRRVWNENHPDVCIYSLKADLWRCPSTSPTRFTSGKIWNNYGRPKVFGNKIEDSLLHYLLFCKIESDGRVTLDYRIARFDVASEKCIDDLNLPVEMNDDIQLRQLDGWLYIHGIYSNDVWIMEEYGSWKKMFRLPQDLAWHYIITRCSKDGHHRLLLQYYQGSENSIKWYNHRDNTIVPFEIEATVRPDGVSPPPLILCIIPSLVPIPGCSSTMLQEIKD
ncbi:F-box/kelch-repeat protein At3g23880-like [Silene latifolia]|uniref:F-box/kelch-repeat protein At3g23880-like n=1 Tax=Silene latifolia TaxID=37657 RepID=UPI003D7835BA